MVLTIGFSVSHVVHVAELHLLVDHITLSLSDEVSCDFTIFRTLLWSMSMELDL